MHVLDLSRGHLRLCQRHLKLEGVTTKGLNGDKEHMPYPDNGFDVVHSFGVLHPKDHMPWAVSTKRRGLRPGGLTIIGVYHRDGLCFRGQTVLLNGLKERGFLNTAGVAQWRESKLAPETSLSRPCACSPGLDRAPSSPIFRGSAFEQTT